MINEEKERVFCRSICLKRVASVRHGSVYGQWRSFDTIEALSWSIGAVCSHEAFLLDLCDVSCLSIIRRHALLGLPCVPLGAALWVEHAWALSGVVANGGLLEQAVELKLVIVAHSSDLILDLLAGHASTGILKRHLSFLFLLI